MSHWPAARSARAASRALISIKRAAVQTLTHGSLRRRHDDAGQVETLRHDDLEEESRGHHVYIRKTGEVGQVVLIGGQMENGIDAAQEVGHEVAIAHVALEELDLRAQVGSDPVPMHWWQESIEHGDVDDRGSAAGHKCASR